MKKINKVLLLDAGGPGSMAAMQLIKRAGLAVETIAGDMDEYSPARLVADVFVVLPAASSPDYAKAVENIISGRNIDMVLPSFHFGYQKLSTIDTDVFVNSFAVSLLCQDKWLFYKWCVDHNYNVPETNLLRDTKHITGKSYLKPGFGAGSKNNFVISSNDELEAVRCLVGDTEEYLVQEFIAGEQWSVEAMRLDGQLVSCSTLRVVNHKAGNTTTAHVKDNQDLQKVCQALLRDLDYQGPANIDVIKDASGQFLILEVNPRFGSTIQFTAQAGANPVAYLLTGEEKFLSATIEGYYANLSEAKLLQ